MFLRLLPQVPPVDAASILSPVDYCSTRIAIGLDVCHHPLKKSHPSPLCIKVDSPVYDVIFSVLGDNASFSPFQDDMSTKSNGTKVRVEESARKVTFHHPNFVQRLRQFSNSF